MQDFWNERYSAIEYAYGKEPNHFIKQELSKLPPGKILFPAEGEGRNAVYAAKLGWRVKAFDPSLEGRKKALQLARQHNVTIDYRLLSYHEMDFKPESFDCLVLVFAHMPAQHRCEIHRKLAELLKPGGKLLLEGFSKAQINRDSGGPRTLEMLFSKAELSEDFKHFSSLNIDESETWLDEGPYHRGTASVIRVLGTK